MRRFALLVAAAAAAGTLSTPADASLYCNELHGIPGTGWGPFCTVQCVMGVDPKVDPKDVRGTLGSLVIVCPA